VNSGNQVTAGGFVPAAGEGQAFWSPDRLTVPKAGRDLRATPFAAGQAPAVPRQPPATGRDRDSAQPHANPGRACPPVGRVRDAAVIGRRWS
jgi:hypothetical protein